MLFDIPEDLMMKRMLHFGAIALLSALCLIPVTPMVAKTPEIAPAVNQKIDFSRHFRDLGVEGSILIYDLKGDRTFQHNPTRNATAFLPASTFKILNSLIALETGVMADEVSVLTWDGIEREGPGWNRDMNMREAMKRSAVWFYQVIARRVGYERMQEWVGKVGYGNQRIGRKSDIDRFWLSGELRTTPQEQIAFLRRLYGGQLPFQGRSMGIVKDIMTIDQTPGYVLRGKTGWVGYGEAGLQVGWFVGWVEKGEDVYFFATNIDIREPKNALARGQVTRRCLKDLGVL